MLSNVQDSNPEEGKRNKKEHIYSDADEHIQRARVTHVRILLMFPGFPPTELDWASQQTSVNQFGSLAWAGEGGGMAFCTKRVYSGIFLIIIYSMLSK